MDAPLKSTLVKVLAPAIGIALALFVSRRRGLSWRDDLGFRPPGARALALWLGVWVAWIALGEVVIRTFGLAQAQPWPPEAPLVLALRVLAIGLLGPIAEELVMRGILLDRLARTRLGPWVAIAIVAAVWAGMHLQYDAATIALIFADGLVLGLARVRGGSLWIPIAMHVLGNLVSIGQSLGLRIG